MNPNVKCSPLNDFPVNLVYAAGGLIQNKPVICSGYEWGRDISKKCYILRTKAGSFEMSKEFEWMNLNLPGGSIVMNDKLWIARNKVSKLINFDGMGNLMASTGAPLFNRNGAPLVLKNHKNDAIFKYHNNDNLRSECIIKIDDKYAIMTGGKFQLNKTLFVNETSPSKFKFKLGLEMKTGRYGHSCGTFLHQNKITAKNETYLVVVGGKIEEGKNLKSTEILDITNGGEWIADRGIL